MRRELTLLLTVALTVFAALVIGCGTGKRSNMERLLAEADSMNRNYIPFTTDSVMLDVVDYYDRHGTPNERMRAHYLLGCVYRDLGEAPHAVDCYLDAIAKADTTSADCDFHTLSCVYSQMAWLYHQQLLLSNEIEARKQSKHYAYYANDTLNAIYEQGMAAGVYLMINKRDSAELLLCEAISLYHKYDRVQDGLKLSMVLMHLFVDQPNRMPELKQLIEQYDAESDVFDEHHELPPSKRQFYYYKGRFFENTNQLDSAEQYYKKIYHSNMRYVDKNPMYKGLLSVYGKRHLADSIAKYAMLYCMATDSSVIIKDQQQTAQLAASYDYHFYKEQSLENENKALWAFIAFAVTLFLLTVLVVGVVYLVKRFRKVQVRLRRFHLEREEELLLIHQQEKEELQRAYFHKQEQAKQEYEQKLTQLQLRQEEELTASKKKEMSKKYFSHDVVLRSIRVANDSHQSLTEKAFDDLLIVTYEHFPMMLQEFEQAEAITTQMKRVCVLSILDVRVDDIGRLLKVSPQRITNLRAELSLLLFNKKTARLFESNLRKHFGIKKV